MIVSFMLASLCGNNESDISYYYYILVFRHKMNYSLSSKDKNSKMGLFVLTMFRKLSWILIVQKDVNKILCSFILIVLHRSLYFVKIYGKRVSAY